MSAILFDPPAALLFSQKDVGLLKLTLCWFFLSCILSVHSVKSEQCFSQFFDQILMARSAKTLITSNAQACANACSDEQSFHCVSANFITPRNKCILFPFDRTGKPGLYARVVQKDVQVIYIERCNDTIAKDGPAAFTENNRGTCGVQENNKAVTIPARRETFVQNVEECVKHCVDETQFRCLSVVVVANRTCMIYDVSRTTNREFVINSEKPSTYFELCSQGLPGRASDNIVARIVQSPTQEQSLSQTEHSGTKRQMSFRLDYMKRLN